MGGAAELFTRHVFLDLETTGLDPRVDEVIELGALFVEKGQVVDRYAQLFSASRPLPLTIRRLTGIEDAMLAGQPRLGQELPELRERLAGLDGGGPQRLLREGLPAGAARPLARAGARLVRADALPAPGAAQPLARGAAALGAQGPARAPPRHDGLRGHPRRAGARDGGLPPRRARRGPGGPARDVGSRAPRCGWPRWRRARAAESWRAGSDPDAAPLVALLTGLWSLCRARPAALEAGDLGLPARPPERQRARWHPAPHGARTRARPCCPCAPRRWRRCSAREARWSAPRRASPPAPPSSRWPRPWRTRSPRADSSRWRRARARASRSRTWRPRRSSPRATGARSAWRRNTKTLQDQLIEKDLPAPAPRHRRRLRLRAAQGPDELPLPPPRAGGHPRGARA